MLFFAFGKPCLPSEYMLEFVLYDPATPTKFRPLATLPVSESAKIAAVKEILAARMGGSGSGSGSGAMDPRCLRLRDKRAGVGAILRDNTTVLVVRLRLRSGAILRDNTTVLAARTKVNVQGHPTRQHHGKASVRGDRAR